MFRTKHVSLFVCLAFVVNGCNLRNYNDASVKEEVQKQQAGCENSWEVTASQFENELKKTDVNAFLDEVAALPEAQKASQMLNVAPTDLKKWILVTTTPLSMSFCGFQQSGTLRHKAESLKAFMQSIFFAMDQSTIARDKALLHMNFRNREFEDVAVFPDVAMLRLAGRRAGIDSGLFRMTQNGDDVPISTEQKEIYEASELKDLLSFVPTDPQVDANGQPSPRFLMKYIKMDAMYSQSGTPGAFALWQQSITDLEKKSLQEFKIGLSMAFRQCIAIHPFADANGRSCRVWMTGALARRGVRFPIMWNGVDIALPIGQWQARWLKAIEDHEKIVP